MGGYAIGSLAGQLSGRDDLTRQAFVDAFARWEAPLIAGLRRMQESGELRADVDVDVTELADLTMAAIQGGPPAGPGPPYTGPAPSRPARRAGGVGGRTHPPALNAVHLPLSAGDPVHARPCRKVRNLRDQLPPLPALTVVKGVVAVGVPDHPSMLIRRLGPLGVLPRHSPHRRARPPAINS